MINDKQLSERISQNNFSGGLSRLRGYQEDSVGHQGESVGLSRASVGFRRVWGSSIGPPEGKRALPLGKKPYIRASYLGGSAFFGFHKDICGVSNAKTFSIKGLLSHDS